MRLPVNILFTQQQLQFRGHVILSRLSTLSMIALEQYS